MTTRHPPDAERPRVKLLARAAHALSDAELLGVLLGSGIRGCSAVELARALIGEFGSLRALMNAERARFRARCGIGPARYRLLAFEELFRGTIDRAGVHPREVLRQTLAHNAAAVIFAHNHPSGVLEPSQADELITRRLKEALALIDVRVLDHFIVGDGQCYSFSERGLL
jgi:DNA repair protein RadC